jgi:hypothetical protein
VFTTPAVHTQFTGMLFSSPTTIPPPRPQPGPKNLEIGACLICAYVIVVVVVVVVDQPLPCMCPSPSPPKPCINALRQVLSIRGEQHTRWGATATHASGHLPAEQTIAESVDQADHRSSIVVNLDRDRRRLGRPTPRTLRCRLRRLRVLLLGLRLQRLQLLQPIAVALGELARECLLLVDLGRKLQHELDEDPARRLLRLLPVERGEVAEAKAADLLAPSLASGKREGGLSVNGWKAERRKAGGHGRAGVKPQAVKFPTARLAARAPRHASKRTLRSPVHRTPHLPISAVSTAVSRSMSKREALAMPSLRLSAAFSSWVHSFALSPAHEATMFSDVAHSRSSSAHVTSLCLSSLAI